MLTKIDKISPTALAKQQVEAEKVLAKYRIAYPVPVPVSALKGTGVAELQCSILGACGIRKIQTPAQREKMWQEQEKRAGKYGLR